MGGKVSNEARRERYKSDPEYRQKQLENSRRYQKDNETPGSRRRENYVPSLERTPEERSKKNALSLQRYYERREDLLPVQRAKQARYRKEKPESIKHWNLERKARKLRQSDGTVTPEFIKTLLDSDQCFYCRITPVSRKTIEHMIPLRRGGLHSILNIVLACHDCNSSKALKTASEFLLQGVL